MRVWINGNKRADESGAELSAQACALKHDDYTARLESESELLKLKNATNGSEYLSRYLTQVRRCRNVDPARYSRPCTQGIKARIGNIICNALWRILRYQHFWMASQQNCVNALIIEGLDAEHTERQRESGELLKRIEHLEQVIKELKAN
jgi:hypothetical protein